VWYPTNATTSYSASSFTSPIYSMAYLPSGEYFVIQRSNSLELRRASDGATLLQHNASAFAISPDDDQIAIGTDRGLIQTLKIPSGETIQVIYAHAAQVYALAFSQDGKTLVSSGEDCRVLAWEAQSGRLLRSYEENATDAYRIGKTSRVFIYGL
jgi:WD40 repeat protein